jgi:hypothetical protein
MACFNRGQGIDKGNVDDPYMKLDRMANSTMANSPITSDFIDNIGL